MSVETIRRWMREDRLTEHRTPGGHRRVDAREVAALENGLEIEELSGSDVIVGYARVSSHDQKKSGDLDRQVARLKDHGCGEVFTDVASGLSDRRNGLRRLFERVQAGGVTEVQVQTRDRLARFGVRFIEDLLTVQGVRLTVLESEESDGSPEQELVADLLSLVASFSGRLYGIRSARRRKMMSTVEREIAA